ncbi:MAG: glycine zipper 2TM domain-containing protein [Burkholderiaceae bacterium]|nr:glycine zipper 2TM domain-containing protein [Burkholderiaceae bacterium]
MDGLEPTTKKLHPLVATAAVAVIAVSVLGAIVLVMNQVNAQRAPETAAVATDTTTGATAPPPAAAQSPAPEAASPAPQPPTEPHQSHPAKRKAPAAQVADALNEQVPPPPAGSPPAPPPDLATAAPPPAPVCSDCGIVAAVHAIKTPGQGTGIGAVAGGVVGGVVGNQFGKGHGNTAMTVLGVLGGALGGNEVEKQAKAATHFDVDVRMDTGQLRTVSVPADPGPIIGTRVRIQNGQLYRDTPQS